MPIEPETRAWRSPHSWAARDRSWTQRLQAALAHPLALAPLVAVSVLGDGLLWTAIIVGLPWLGGPSGIACALRMLCLVAINLVIYQAVKRCCARPRPYVACPDIRACTRALDQYSFPSGHTLHAVGFSLVLCHYYPGLAWIAWPFTAMLALSRVALGLHYPSDVAAAAGIACVTTWLVFCLF